MEEDKTRIWNGIFVRMLIPLAAVLLLIFFLLHALTLSTVNSFLEKHMREKMQWITSSVFEICDRNFNDFLFMSSGILVNHAIVQARTMDNIEVYLEGHNLSGMIVSDADVQVFSHALPFDHDVLLEKTKHLPAISTVKINGNEYLAGKLDFEPWGWKMIILQDVLYYEAMLEGIKNVFWALAVILGVGIIVFIFLTVVNVTRPLSRIIGRIRKEDYPDYRGVAEFTYLSNAIEQMMKSISSKNRFISSLFNTLSAIVLVVDKNGRIVMVNNYLCYLTGFERESIVGRMLWDLVPRKKSVLIKRLFEQHRQGIMVDGQEMSIISKDRRKINVLWHSRQIQDNESGLEWIIYTGSDITALKRTEKSLEMERMLIYSLFESSPLAQMVISPEGEVLDVNEQFKQLTGYDVRDAGRLETWLAGIMDDSKLAKEVMSKWPIADEGSTVSRQVRIIDRAGNNRDVEFTFATLPDGRAVSFLMDMTDKLLQEKENRRMVKELYQARKMEAIGVLAGGIAHDFNNILQAISVQVQAMEMGRLKDNEEKTPYLSRIESLVDRGVSIIKRVLTFSRRVEPELSMVDFNELMHQEVELMRRALPRMIEIRELPDYSISKIYIDRHQMELVLMNLINNARDSISGSGVIEVSTSEIVVDSDSPYASRAEPGRYVMFKVSDSGHGMDEEVMEQMFDPFYTTKEPGKGTGLGLPTAYGIVKTHSGYIFCDSEPGRGTVFSVLVPVHDAAEDTGLDQHHEQSEGSLTGKEAILVVDDEEDIRELTLEMLESFGYRTFGAESGEEALEIYSRQPVDLVVMDLGMPGMGGEQCARRMLEADPQARIIIASGYMDHHMARKPGKYGLAGFIHKPYQLRELLKKIRSLSDEGPIIVNDKGQKTAGG